MAARARNLMGAAVFSATFFTAGPAAAGHDPQTIVVHVRNYAEVPSDTLGRAEQRAAGVYAAAGVRTLWVVEGADKDLRTTSAPRQLTVLLLSRDMAERWIAARRVGDDVLGQAVRPAKRAYVFFYRVTGMAEHSHDVAIILGNVIAHEIGHLVLPTSDHSTTGIMRAGLDVGSTASQRFSDAQGVAIRAIVAGDAKPANP